MMEFLTDGSGGEEFRSRGEEKEQGEGYGAGSREEVWAGRREEEWAGSRVEGVMRRVGRRLLGIRYWVGREVSSARHGLHCTAQDTEYTALKYTEMLALHFTVLL